MILLFLNLGLRNILPITTAKVPIVKFFHLRSGLEVDISLYNTLVRWSLGRLRGNEFLCFSVFHSISKAFNLFVILESGILILVCRVSSQCWICADCCSGSGDTEGMQLVLVSIENETKGRLIVLPESVIWSKGYLCRYLYTLKWAQYM